VRRKDATPGRFSVKAGAMADWLLKLKFMNKLFKILAVVSVAGLVLGLSNVGDEMFSGFCRAFGAVFFILAFITKTIDKAEHTAS
jgi:hypothetical protein